MRLIRRRDSMFNQRTAIPSASQNFVKVKYAESHHGHKRHRIWARSDLPLLAV